MKTKCVLLTDVQSGALELGDIELGDLKSGQVLVQLAAAAINPSDLVFLRGRYGIQKTLPVVPGFEGSGTVMEAGPGLLGRLLVGKRVACKARENGHGTWATWMIADATACIPLRSSVSFEEAAGLIINPLTAYALVQRLRKAGATTFVQTAAGGALGKMIARLSHRFGMTGIHIVRSATSAQKLIALGCGPVLQSESADFAKQLKDVCGSMKPRVVLDAVGGPLLGQIVSAMPVGARAIVYGALGGEPCEINPVDLIFRQTRVEGFWLTDLMKQESFLSKIRITRAVQTYLHDALKTDIQGRFPLDRYADALALYKSKRSDGKVLLINV